MGSPAPHIFDLLWGELTRIPYLALFAVGLIVALRRRDRHPRASLLAAWGCGLQLLGNLGSLVNRALLMGGGALPARALTYGAFGSALAVVYLAGWICILTAVFADRPE